MAADWKDIEADTKEKYGLYLASREWSVLKRAVHDRAGGKCERCKVNPIDAVHHLTYVRKYDELLEDLQATCDECHRFVHGHSDEDPSSTYDGAIIDLTRVRGSCWDTAFDKLICLDYETFGERKQAYLAIEFGTMLRATGCILAIHLKSELDVRKTPRMDMTADMTLDEMRRLFEVLKNAIAIMDHR
jgi:hypothetical protein